MPQSNGLSNVIQDPVTEAEDMDYDFNPSNKRKISSTHTQRPNHAIQFNSQPFIPPCCNNTRQWTQTYSLKNSAELSVPYHPISSGPSQAS